MANKKISELPNLVSSGVTPNDLLAIVNSGQTKNIKTIDFLSYIQKSIVIDVLHSEMLNLVNTSGLTSGQLYRITDFRTKHKIFASPNIATEYGVNLGPIEPLIVLATSENTLDKEAYSELYPEDMIYYELVDQFSTTYGGDRGRIYYRKDTRANVEFWLDWRVVKTRRFASQTLTLTSNSGFKEGEKVSDGTYTGTYVRAIDSDKIVVKAINGPLSGTITGNFSLQSSTILSLDYVYDLGYGWGGSTFNGSDLIRFYISSLNNYEINYLKNELVSGRRVNANGITYIIDSFIGVYPIGDPNGPYVEFKITTNALSDEDNIFLLFSQYDNVEDNGTDGLDFVTLKGWGENVSVKLFGNLNEIDSYRQCNVFKILSDVNINQDCNASTANFIISEVSMGRGSSFIFSEGDSITRCNFWGGFRGIVNGILEDILCLRYTDDCVFLGYSFGNIFQSTIESSVFKDFSGNKVSGQLTRIYFGGSNSCNINCTMFSNSEYLEIPSGFNNNHLNGDWSSFDNIPLSLIKINQDFRNNLVRVPIGPSNADFSSATHVYQNYTCEIVEGSDSNPYLKYLDVTPPSLPIEQYVSPTS